MRIAAYCRVSTDSEQQLDSLENQKAFLPSTRRKTDMNWPHYTQTAALRAPACEDAQNSSG